jgi:DNA integrity scanning protein DisA with diadenylate cyclase activity
MQKIIAFLNKHSIIINSLSIAFWIYIIYSNYKTAKAENSFDERKGFFIIPVLFILLSVFNMYMAQKRNKA